MLLLRLVLDLNLTHRSIEMPVPRAELAAVFCAPSAELITAQGADLEPEIEWLRKSHGTGKLQDRAPRPSPRAFKGVRGISAEKLDQRPTGLRWRKARATQAPDARKLKEPSYAQDGKREPS